MRQIPTGVARGYLSALDPVTGAPLGPDEPERFGSLS